MVRVSSRSITLIMSPRGRISTCLIAMDVMMEAGGEVNSYMTDVIQLLAVDTQLR